ncbi:UNVERIFIED_ORG: hypothetical protein ABID57_003672, partial [Arthrobacter sp. UYEF1]
CVETADGGGFPRMALMPADAVATVMGAASPVRPGTGRRTP